MAQWQQDKEKMPEDKWIQAAQELDKASPSLIAEVPDNWAQAVKELAKPTSTTSPQISELPADWEQKQAQKELQAKNEQWIQAKQEYDKTDPWEQARSEMYGTMKAGPGTLKETLVNLVPYGRQIFYGEPIPEDVTRPGMPEAGYHEKQIFKGLDYLLSFIGIPAAEKAVARTAMQAATEQGIKEAVPEVVQTLRKTALMSPEFTEKAVESYLPNAFRSVGKEAATGVTEIIPPVVTKVTVAPEIANELDLMAGEIGGATHSIEKHFGGGKFYTASDYPPWFTELKSNKDAILRGIENARQGKETPFSRAILDTATERANARSFETTNVVAADLNEGDKVYRLMEKDPYTVHFEKTGKVTLKDGEPFQVEPDQQITDVTSVQPAGTPTFEQMKPQSLGAAQTFPKFAGRELGPPYTMQGSSVNLERLDVDEQAKNIMNELGKTMERKRVSWEEADQIAKDQGFTLGGVSRIWNKTQGLNSNQLNFLRQMNVDMVSSISKVMDSIKGTPTPEQTEAIQLMLTKYKSIFGLTSQSAAEAGRTLSILRREISPQERFTQLFDVGDQTKISKFIEMWKTTDFEKLGMDQKQISNLISKAAEAKSITSNLYKIWINSILSNPATHTANVIGNTLANLVRIPEKGLASGYDFLYSKATGAERTRYLGEMNQEIFGFISGIRQSIGQALAYMQGKEFAPKYILPAAADISKAEEMTRASWELPSAALSMADRFFKVTNYAMDINSQAFRIAVNEGKVGAERAARIAELIANPTEAMVKEAGEGALFRTFNNPVGKFGQALYKLRDYEIESLGGVRLLAYIMPFLRTPINLLKYGLKYTPLNFGYLGFQKLAGGGMAQAQMVTELSRATIGSLVGAFIAYEAGLGNVTGEGPSNKAERETLQRTGWQPYSIKLGNTWYSYNRLEPFATLLGLTADYVQLSQHMTPQEKEKIATQISHSITSNILSKTYMSGLSSMFQAMSDPDRYGEKWLSQAISGFVPNVVAAAGRGMDPYQSDAKTVLDSIKKRIPIVRESLPPSLNLWGQPKTYDQSFLGSMINPIYISNQKDDPVDKEFMRLNLHIGMPDTKLGSLDLDPFQYNKFVQAAGVPAKAILDKLVVSPGYRAMNDYQKEKSIESVVNTTRTQAKYQMLQQIQNPVDKLRAILPSDAQKYLFKGAQ